MPGQGRVVGVNLLVIGLLVLLIGASWLLLQLSQHNTTPDGALLGFFILAVIVLPLCGGGVYLMTKGRQETAEFAEIQKEKTILNMVLAQGKVTLGEAALETHSSRDQVENYVRDLVGKSLFSGAINWKDGVLYSRQAQEMKADQKCPNCGGQLELVGKGMIKCPYCGAEVFLAS